MHLMPKANKKFVNMTREGYTHVLIPKSFHSVLKVEAEKNKTSIWRYIDSLIQSKNSMNTEQPGKLVGLGSPREFESPPRRLFFYDYCSGYLSFSIMLQGTPVTDLVLEKRGILARVHEASYRFLFFRLLSAKMGTKIVRVAIFRIYNP